MYIVYNIYNIVILYDFRLSGDKSLQCVKLAFKTTFILFDFKANNAYFDLFHFY